MSGEKITPQSGSPSRSFTPGSGVDLREIQFVKDVQDTKIAVGLISVETAETRVGLGVLATAFKDHTDNQREVNKQTLLALSRIEREIKDLKPPQQIVKFSDPPQLPEPPPVPRARTKTHPGREQMQSDPLMTLERLAALQVRAIEREAEEEDTKVRNQMLLSTAQARAKAAQVEAEALRETAERAQQSEVNETIRRARAEAVARAWKVGAILIGLLGAGLTWAASHWFGG